jgi:hypothetical protein
LTGVPVSTPAVDSPKKELPNRRPYNLFYDDYRWQQRPSEALKFRQELSFLSRKNAQPARPRGASKVFQPAYTAGSADARIDANLQFIRRTYCRLWLRERDQRSRIQSAKMSDRREDYVLMLTD